MPGVNEIIHIEQQLGKQEASSALGSEAVFMLHLTSEWLHCSDGEYARALSVHLVPH